MDKLDTEGHRKEFHVRYYELGGDGALRLRTLLDYLQDAAAEHAALLGIGMEALMAREITWVLSPLLLEVGRYPGGGERVCVETWPSSREGISAAREFLVSDAAGRVVARARTLWVLVDVRRRRPLRLATALPDYPLSGIRALERDFSTLPAPAEDREAERFPVLRGDLDVNRHVNNAVYVAWALESAVGRFGRTAQPAEVEVLFRAEAFAGDVVLARCAAERGAPAREPLLHSLASAADGRELARLRTRWA